MPRTPPIPSPHCPLSDIQGYAYVRRKLVAPRHHHFLQLNGSVLSASASPNAPPEWEISVLHTTVHANPRRNGFILTLPSNVKLYIYLEQQQHQLRSSVDTQLDLLHPHQLDNRYSDQQSDQNQLHFYKRRRYRRQRQEQRNDNHLYRQQDCPTSQQHKSGFLVSDWVEALQIAATRDFHARYRLQDKIGEGAFATVHRARCKITGQLVAVKCVRRSEFDHITARELQREMFAVKHLHHPNVVRGREVFNSLRDVHMVMDFMRGGTLKDVVQFLGGRVTETFAKHIMRQVLSACDFLHRHGYVHRDVKLENVLCENKVMDKGSFQMSRSHPQRRKEIRRVYLNEIEDHNDDDDDDDEDNEEGTVQRTTSGRYQQSIDKMKLRRKGHDDDDIAFVMKTMGRVRLADFGYVNFLTDFRHPCLSSLLGTPVYIAPEIIRKAKYGTPVDIYAVGVMLYRMLSGHYPYDGRDDDDKTLHLAVEAELAFPDPAWRRTSRKCRSFVRALLQPFPERRLTARTALLHPWLDDVAEEHTTVNCVGRNEVECADDDDDDDGDNESKNNFVGDNINAYFAYGVNFERGAMGNGASSPISPVSASASASASASVSGGSMAGEGDGAKSHHHHGHYSKADGRGQVDWEVSKKDGVPTYVQSEAYNAWCLAPFAKTWSAPARHALYRVRVAARAASFIGKLAVLSGIRTQSSSRNRNAVSSEKMRRLHGINTSYEEVCEDDEYDDANLEGEEDDDEYYEEDDEEEEEEYDEDDDDDDDDDDEYDDDEDDVEVRGRGRRGLWHGSGAKDLRRRSTRGSLVGLANRLARASSFSRPQPHGRGLRFGAIGDKLRRTMTLGRK